MASILSIDSLLSLSLANASALLLLVYLAWTAQSYWRLRHFPGPWPARFTRLWYAKLILSGSMNTDTAVLFEKYGKSITAQCLEAVSSVEVRDKGLSSGLVRIPW